MASPREGKVMGVEVRAVGVTCNLACTYCYQHPIRDAGNFVAGYDLNAIKEALLRAGEPFTLFGGEPLLMPMEDLEELLRFGYEHWGYNSIQTNGSLITDRHIELFRRYRCHVGISVDGPDELNDARWAGSLEKTRDMTARTMRAIDRLLDAGLVPSLIVTLHRLNASEDRRPKLKAWLREMDAKGVTSARLHELEVDHPLVRARLKLTEEETIAAFRDMRALERSLSRLRFDVFADITRMLLGEDNHATCIWTGCDPWATRAARGIHADGTETNCTRPFKDGVDWPKAEASGFERYLALYHTPQEYGGCGGCRFFLACRGNCPGTGIVGDWRNRSESCGLWKALMEDAEQELVSQGKIPVSLHPKRSEWEADLLRQWAAAQPARLSAGGHVRSEPCVCRHGDDHGDSPHGDAHGDHWDLRALGGVRGVAPVGAP